jgi:hypothetical protein
MREYPGQEPPKEDATPSKEMAKGKDDKGAGSQFWCLAHLSENNPLAKKEPPTRGDP